MSEKEELERVLQQVKWIQENISLVSWKPEDYGRLFGHRKIGEVIESKQTNFMNPCPDLTPALIVRLRENGFNPTMVVQELTARHTNKPSFHFAIELPISKSKYTIDFKTGKIALVYKGRYSLKKSSQSFKNLGITRFSTEKLGRNASLLQFLEIKDWKDIGKVLKHVKYEHVLASANAIKKAAENPRYFRIISKIKPRIRHL